MNDWPNQEPDSIQTPPARKRTGLYVALAGVLIAAAVAVGGWWWLRKQGPEPLAQPAGAVAHAPGAAEPEGGPSVSREHSDQSIDAWARRLSNAPGFAAWMEGGDLARRFAAVVFTVADGGSPVNLLRPLAPVGAYAAEERGGKLYATAASHARYDGVAQIVASIDVSQAAQAFTALEPLFEAAHAEIAPPGQKVRATLQRALAHLAEVPAPEGELALVEQGALYTYEDPTFERLSIAQKHLVRMGPSNQQNVQNKIRELQSALGMRAERP